MYEEKEGENAEVEPTEQAGRVTASIHNVIIESSSLSSSSTPPEANPAGRPLRLVKCCRHLSKTPTTKNAYQADRRAKDHARAGPRSRVFWALGDCHVMRSRRRATVAEAVSVYLHSS